MRQSVLIDVHGWNRLDAIHTKLERHRRNMVTVVTINTCETGKMLEECSNNHADRNVCPWHLH